MTKRLKSGGDKNISTTNRDLENHVVEEFKTTDGKDTWSGHELEVKSDPLVESGDRGQTVLLRSFYFKANPETLKRDKPTKQMIFNSHVQQISTMLWSDGLIPFEKIPPKLIVSKKRDEYKIFVTCIAKRGVYFDQSPKLLQEITNSLKS